jgi:hypothetical protein
VVADVKQRRFKQAPLVGAEAGEAALAIAPRRKALHDQARQRFAVLRQVSQRRAGGEPHDQLGALRTEGIAEHHVGQRRKEFPLPRAESLHARNVCQARMQCHRRRFDGRRSSHTTYKYQSFRYLAWLVQQRTPGAMQTMNENRLTEMKAAMWVALICGLLWAGDATPGAFALIGLAAAFMAAVCVIAES